MEEAPPGGTQEAPGSTRRHPGGTSRHPGGTQEAPTIGFPPLPTNSARLRPSFGIMSLTFVDAFVVTFF